MDAFDVEYFRAVLKAPFAMREGLVPTILVV